MEAARDLWNITRCSLVCLWSHSKWWPVKKTRWTNATVTSMKTSASKAQWRPAKSGKILEAELRTQAVVLETLNTSLYHCQIELQREKTMAGNLEKLFQTKLAEAEEKYKSTIQVLTEENNSLRQKVLTISTNEEIFEERSEKSSSASPNIYESWTQQPQKASFVGNKLPPCLSSTTLGRYRLRKTSLERRTGKVKFLSCSGYVCLLFLYFQFAFFRMVRNVWMLISIISWLFPENWCPLCWSRISVGRALCSFLLFTYFIGGEFEGLLLGWCLHFGVTFVPQG